MNVDVCEFVSIVPNHADGPRVCVVNSADLCVSDECKPLGKLVVNNNTSFLSLHPKQTPHTHHPTLWLPRDLNGRVNEERARELAERELAKLQGRLVVGTGNKERVIDHLFSWHNNHSSPPDLPPDEVKLPTPLLHDRFEELLTARQDRLATLLLLDTIRNGANLAYTGDHDQQRALPVNRPTADEHLAVIREQYDKEVKAGRVAGPFNTPPFRNPFVSPLGVVPKTENGKHTGYRVIFDMSAPHNNSANTGIEPLVTTMDQVSKAINMMKQHGAGCHMWKRDVKSAFRLVPVRAQDQHLLCSQFDGRYYFDRCLTFGCSSSPALFERVAKALTWAATNGSHPQVWQDQQHQQHTSPHFSGPISDLALHVDDVFGAASSATEAQASYDYFTAVAAYTGVPLAAEPHKTVPPTTTITFCGVVLNSVEMTASLTKERLSHYAEKIHSLLSQLSGRSATRKEAQSVLGILMFVTSVLPPGRAMLNHLIHDLSGNDHRRHVHLSGNTRGDLRWWLGVLRDWHGTWVLLPDVAIPANQAEIYQDACEWGQGGYFHNEYFSQQWSAEDLAEAGQAATEDDASDAVEVGAKRRSMPYLELRAALSSISLWGGNHWTRKKVIVRSDSMSTVHAVNSFRTKSPRVARLLRILAAMQIQHNFLIIVKHIPGTDNTLADLLSRNQVHRYLAIARRTSTNSQSPLSQRVPLGVVQLERNYGVLPPTSS
jgi:hypothetical protein